MQPPLYKQSSLGTTWRFLRRSTSSYSRRLTTPPNRSYTPCWTASLHGASHSSFAKTLWRKNRCSVDGWRMQYWMPSLAAWKRPELVYQLHDLKVECFRAVWTLQCDDSNQSIVVRTVWDFVDVIMRQAQWISIETTRTKLSVGKVVLTSTSRIFLFILVFKQGGDSAVDDSHLDDCSDDSNP